MPKASKKSAQEEVHEAQAQGSTQSDVNESSQDEIPSSDQESDPEVTLNPRRSQPQVIPSMFMPYIEGPKMDWTVNDGLYHRFLKWHLKCENILECELAALPERQQCKKVIAWSGDFGMDQYVSWGLSTDQLTLKIIWGKFEDFCKPQSNEVCARFDLLTSFRQGNRSVDEWYNVVQAQVNLAKYPPETAKILQRDIFWFFLHDEEFVSKTINDGSVDLEKFPASKVRQLAKKLESSKVTARHIKQVAGDPQAAQINLLRHQRTELPAGKYKKKRSGIKPRQSNHKNQSQEGYHLQVQPKKRCDTRGAHNDRTRFSKCGDSVHVEGFQCPAKKYQCKACHKFGHFTSMCFQKKQAPIKHRKPKVHQIQAGSPHAHRSASYDHSDEDSTSDESFCLQLKIKRRQARESKVPKATHLITNLAYRLQPHHHRNMYLRARLDTCADVNLMPASIYKLIFKDPQMKKLTPSTLQVGTYTTDTVKIVGSCKFHLVHPDTKKLLETTFYVAINDGSVLLSCKTTLQLGLIQPRARLDYLLPRASLITSSADHPKKTKEVLHTQKKQVAAQKEVPEKVAQLPAVKEKGPKLITSKEMIMQEYPNVFQGIGKFPGPDYHIQIDPSVPPKQTPCRPIPIQLHEGHLGLNKCKLRAKETVYWPGLNNQLENLVLNCELCLKYSTAKCKLEPSLMLGQEVPLYPWTKLATDIFNFEGVSYLLVVDYTSHYPIVHKLASMTGQHIASHFKLICSEYGWPDTLVSDNGPCYTSEVFTNLMSEYNINHITSSPHYPQSNGLAEKYVQIVKNLFYKAKEEGKDLYHSLMVYCNTPLSSNLQSPMQILTSRSARSDLPMSNAARKQKGLDCEQLRPTCKNEQLPLHDLHLDQAVIYQDPSDKRWYPATITRLCQEPRSYLITTKQGVQYRKTQAHLKPYHPQGEDRLYKQEKHNGQFKVLKIIQ